MRRIAALPAGDALVQRSAWFSYRSSSGLFHPPLYLGGSFGSMDLAGLYSGVHR